MRLKTTLLAVSTPLGLLATSALAGPVSYSGKRLTF